MKEVGRGKVSLYGLVLGMRMYVVGVEFWRGLEGVGWGVVWGNVVWVGLFGSMIWLVVMRVWMEVMGWRGGGILGGVEGVRGVLLGVVVFGEEVSGGMMVGVVMIVSGVRVIIGGKGLVEVVRRGMG